MPDLDFFEPDDLDLDLADQLADPAFRAAFEDAQARSKLLRSCIDIRKQGSQTQQAVAKAMETTQSAVSELESGATDPRLSTLQRYARAVGCRLDVRLVDGTRGRDTKIQFGVGQGALVTVSLIKHAMQSASVHSPPSAWAVPARFGAVVSSNDENLLREPTFAA